MACVRLILPHEISSRIAAADSLHLVLDRIVHFISTVIPCDSCFIYVLEEDNLVVRHQPACRPRRSDWSSDRARRHRMVAKHRQAVALRIKGGVERFAIQSLQKSPEDRFEAMLCTQLCAPGA